jgi:DNA gyrase subunit A
MPHNLTEVVNGILATVDNPEITIDDLMQYIKAPDFPTGGIIYGMQGIKDAFHTGRGKIVLRGKATIEITKTGREVIIITEIPYQISRANLVTKIADLKNEDKVPGISNVRDESGRQGFRVVVEVGRDAVASVVLNKLYKYSPLQTSYGVNNVALVGGRPMTLNLKDMIVEFIKFRLEVIVRRTIYDLRKAEERAHILEGLLIALDHLDQVIKLIRGSRTPEDAREGLMTQFELSEIQARAILDMRLQRLTGLEIDKVQAEFDELQKIIVDLKEILESEERQRAIVKEELLEVKERFGDERRTEITASVGEISIEDLIRKEDVIITITHLGYIKRTPVSEYRAQTRGGRGSRGSKTRNTDFIEHMFVADTHNYLLLFTEGGICHWLRVFEIPEASKTSSGRAIQNILAIPQEDKIKAYIKIEDLKEEAFLESHYIVFATQKGLIKKTAVSAFSRPRTSGIIAITINEGDTLLEAKLTNGKNEILLANRSGYAIRFKEEKVRAMGRTAAGVRGMALSKTDDLVIGMICIDPEDTETSVLVVSENGYGKRSEFSEYRITNRGGKGVRTLMLTEKTGSLIAIKAVKEEDDLMITNMSGVMIRMHVSEIRVMGRATQGVRVMRLNGDDAIADIGVIRKGDDDDEDTEDIDFSEEE